MKDIIIFTDGSARGNPGPGGWAAIIASHEYVVELGGREAHTTNNRMELQAVHEALSKLSNFCKKNNVEATSTHIKIYSDSAYVINGITTWVKGWKRNQWITSTKEPVLHRDLWESIDGLAHGFNIQWIRLKGHSGLPGNERCDEIATGCADNIQVDLFDGSRTRYSINLSQLVSNGIQSSDTSKKKSSAKAFSYVSYVKGKVYIDKVWNECEKRVKGISGVRYKKVFSKEEEIELAKEWGSI